MGARGEKGTPGGKGAPGGERRPRGKKGTGGGKGTPGGKGDTGGVAPPPRLRGRPVADWWGWEIRSRGFFNHKKNLKQNEKSSDFLFFFYERLVIFFYDFRKNLEKVKFLSK